MLGCNDWHKSAKSCLGASGDVLCLSSLCVAVSEHHPFLSPSTRLARHLHRSGTVWLSCEISPLHCPRHFDKKEGQVSSNLFLFLKKNQRTAYLGT